MDEDKRKKNIRSVVVVLAFCLTLCGFWCWMISKMGKSLDDSPTISEVILAEMEQYLSDIANGEVGPIPEDAKPGDCRILYDYMAANDNQYTLTVDRMDERLNQEASLFVDFPDGSRVEAYFYRANLEVCWAIDQEGYRQWVFPQ